MVISLIKFFIEYRGGGKKTLISFYPGLLHCRQILYHLSYREDPIFF